MNTIRLTPAADLAIELPRLSNVRAELAAGIYRLRQPVILGPGNSDLTITGAGAIISGGEQLTGWRVANGRWTLPVDGTFTQLFVNGGRRPRARLPKTGFYHFESLPDGRSTGWYKGATRAVYAAGDCARWSNLADVRIVALERWYEQHLRIAALDEATRTMTFVTRAFSDLHDETGKNARYYVENAFAALTEPGEWCLTGGTLYYIPLPGETPENTEVIAPRVATLVRLEGCRNARLEGLVFRHAEWEMPAENTGAVQAAFNVPGALQLRRATGCVIQNCTVSQVAGYAIEVQLGSTGNKILDCRLHDLGAGGVKINHERAVEVRASEDAAFAGMDLVAMGWAAAPHPDPLPANGERETPSDPLAPSDGERVGVRGDWAVSQTEVARCRIHDGGKIFHSAVGVWIGDSGFNHVHHNEVFDLYYTGISCGWSWNYAPTRCIGNVIEHNHVYNIGRQLLSDMGAIYLLGYQPGGIVRGNHVHDVSCYGYGGSGIYPDQGSSFLTIEDNVVHHTQTDALSIHYGSGLMVRNNVFALTKSSLLARGREESVLTGLVEGNFFYGASPHMLGYFWSNPRTIIFRNNRYCVQGGAATEFAGLTFAEWLALGQDAGSVVDDSVAAFYDRRVAEISSGAAAVIDRRYRALEPRLELGDPTFPTAADGERLTNMPAAVYVNPGQPQRLSLTLTNRDHVPALGDGEFRVTGQATLTGATRFAYRLAPGERVVFAVEVTLAAGAEPVLVTAQGDNLPMVGQCLTCRQDVTIHRGLPVEQQPVRELRARGQLIGQMQLAIAGNRLVLRAAIRDADVKANREQPWAGSGIELFCESATTHHKVQQYFLLPSGAARHDHANSKIVAAPQIECAHEPTADGYVLTARIPLALLSVTATETEFHLEMFVNTHPTPGKLAQAKLFGGSYGWMGMDGWGTVRIEPSGTALPDVSF